MFVYRNPIYWCHYKWYVWFFLSRNSPSLDPFFATWFVWNERVEIAKINEHQEWLYAIDSIHIKYIFVEFATLELYLESHLVVFKSNCMQNLLAKNYFLQYSRFYYEYIGGTWWAKFEFFAWCACRSSTSQLLSAFINLFIDLKIAD